MRNPTIDDDDDENHISVKSVKLPVFTGSHVDFQTWWLRFHAFAMVWKFAGAVGKAPEVDLPISENASLSIATDIQDRQKVAKK